MTQREKVINGLEECTSRGCCTKCEYGGAISALTCKKLMVDVLALLKEQTPGDPEIEGDGRSSWWYVCPDCHGQIDKDDGFCRHCGREIRWT